jgi:hypothetical protein
MSEKAKRELLMPAGRKTAADKTQNLKHNPLEEFRASPYTLPEGEPTYLGIMAASVKRAMAEAALDVPGAAKTQIGRLLWAENQYSQFISVYGIPQLYMAITRMADMNRTPDVRTLAIIPRWAVRVTLRYVEPQLTYPAVMNLLAMAGYTIGIGDGRPQKGKLSFGQFRPTNPDDPEFLEIVEEGSRDAQIAAMDEAIAYDEEASELLGWFNGEAARRGRALR